MRREDEAEPIAIIGIGCRFPGGANSPEAFWRLMRDGVDAISEVPASRFDIDAYYDPRPATPGKLVTRYGGFLDDVDQFDAYFFGISPREAKLMDPQQRLLLEVAWEALEDAALVPAQLADSRTGVFVGMQTNDYEDLMFDDASSIDAVYVNTGGYRSVAAGRLSYALDLHGPSVAVNAACASSLVSVHLACQSLRSGETDLALAAGTNLVLQPHHGIAFCQGSMLSPDGRCKFADARADGFVRSDGVGVTVLKRLSEAQADGDPIYAVIRGSAVNNDGRGGDSMMSPGVHGQEAALREACRMAGIVPGQVQYLECHGTGTSVGDPIEMQAAGAVLAEGRAPDRPCIVGSVKSNIGHTEGAAGIAGLIKAALCLKHRAIPASLHVQELNPKIPWKELPLVVQREYGPWPDDDGPARAGVSSFGINGTNSHVVLEEAPPTLLLEEKAQVPGPDVYLLPLSAHTEEALADMAHRWQAFLSDTAAANGSHLLDICYTASVRRTHHEHRLAVVAGSREELGERLQSFANEESHPDVGSGRYPGRQQPKIVFVCAGQGPQWWAMGRELLVSEPVFRKMIERCDELVRKEGSWSLLDELGRDESSSRLQETAIAQPAIFALQVALASLWESWGIRPDAVVGHSVGEIAAAYLAGALELEDAVRVIFHRGRCMDFAAAHGKMLAVGLPPDEASNLVKGREAAVSLAAVNSPSAVTLSGEPEALHEIAQELERRETFHRFLKVNYAFHSPLMDPMRSELLQALKSIAPTKASLPMVSTVTGVPLNGLELDADYWWKNVRHTVRFASAIEALLEDGYDTFVELSPHPVLAGNILECDQSRGKASTTVLHSLRREQPERATMLSALAKLYALGAPVDWTKLYPARRPPTPLPSYAWQHERFWLERSGNGHRRSQLMVRRGEEGTASHPLLGLLTSAAHERTHLWEMDLGIDSLPYLADHRVGRLIVVPATAYLEMALAAAEQVFGRGAHTLEAVAFGEALVLPEDSTTVRVQVVVTPAMHGTASYQLFSRQRAHDDGQRANPWTRHAAGTIHIGVASELAAPERHDRPADVKERCQQQVSGTDHYETLAARGLQMGPAFRGVEQVWRGDGEALGRIYLPEAAFGKGPYQLHPALLNAGLQVLLAAAPVDDTYLPVSLERLRFFERPGDRLWSHARLRTAEEPGADTIEGDVLLLGDDGNIVAEAVGLRLSSLPRDAQPDVRDWFYEVRWQPKARPEQVAASQLPTGDEPGSWLIFDEGDSLGQALRLKLEAQGQRCVVVTPGEDYGNSGPAGYELNPTEPDDFRRLLQEAFTGDQPPCRGVVHLWSLGATSPEETTLASLKTAQELGCGSVLHLVQALAHASWPNSPRLWLITRDAQAVADGAPSPSTGSSVSVAQAPLWGLGRVIAHEHPELRCTMVDLGPETTPGEAQSVFLELRPQDKDDREDEIALQGDARYVPRLVHCAPPVTAKSKDASLDGTRHRFDPEVDRNFHLKTSGSGILDELVLRATERVEPGPGEVQIRVAAAALNFLDVLKAMGIYPGLGPGALEALGAECSGTVTAVGEGVADVRVGDDVLAITPSFDTTSFISAFVTIPACLAVPKPTQLSFEQATTIPVVFLTAYYALHHLGRLQKGERVLIHSAAGGVGLAAVQLARRAEAEIYATAGSEEKRQFLRSLGIQHVMDSRSLAFAEEVMERTGGEGVDVVLNSLVGEAISKSLAILKPCGRFLEIGKRDIYENSLIGLEPFKKNKSFFAIDVAQLVEERPAFIASLFREIMQGFEDNTLSPLPSQIFPISEVTGAFRHISKAEHIGKIVLSLHGQEASIVPAEEEPATFHAEGTYLITGGLGGLGLTFAQWMVQRGARHLVLIGRSKPSPSAQAVLDDLHEDGAQVVVAGADVSDHQQLSRVLADIKQSMPPLRGVVHAAGVLDDGILLQQSLERFKSVMAPKLDGAWNLHTLTQDAPLDFFVLFSSIGSLLGFPGNANYSAANAFLDALARYRRAQGQPALSINWGPWSEVGLAAAEAKRGGRLGRGLGSISPTQGVTAFGQLLHYETPQVGVMRLDPEQWCEFHPAVAQSSLLAQLAPGRNGAGSPTARRPVGQARPEAEATLRTESWLRSFVQEQVAQVLGLSASRMAPDKRLEIYGLDSLMGVELSERIAASLGLTLPGNVVWQYPTVAALAAHLAEKKRVADLEGRLDDQPSPMAVKPEETVPPVTAAGRHLVKSVGLAEGSQHEYQAGKRSPLVALQPEGSKLPLFLVPPAAVTVSNFGPLLRHLGPDQPVYALQHLGMVGEEPPQDRIEDMAALYIDEIQQVQPCGPYLLGGRCFGGIVALEMALQLHDQGHEVAMLTLFDVLFSPTAPERFLRRPDWSDPADRKLGRWVLYYIGKTSLKLILISLATLDKIGVRVTSVAIPEEKFANLPETQVRSILRTHTAHLTARGHYEPRVYSGKITMFSSAQKRRRGRRRQSSWAEYAAGGLDVHVIPGNHLSMFWEPQVRAVAEQLEKCIDDALAASDGDRRTSTPSTLSAEPSQQQFV